MKQLDFLLIFVILGILSMPVSASFQMVLPFNGSVLSGYPNLFVQNQTNMNNLNNVNVQPFHAQIFGSNPSFLQGFFSKWEVDLHNPPGNLVSSAPNSVSLLPNFSTSNLNNQVDSGPAGNPIWKNSWRGWR